MGSEMCIRDRINAAPLAAALPAGTQKTGTADGSLQDKLKEASILLVEDNLVNHKVAMAMLKKAGFNQVDHAENGAKALAAVQVKRYDLILMDCQMPVMDGYEATRNIRQLEDAYFQQLPILALTAHTMKGDDEKCYMAGMNDYLSKPVRIDELSAKVEKWLSAQLTTIERFHSVS